jgi:hypothetical protein
VDRARDDKGRWRLPGDRDVASASNEPQEPDRYIIKPALAGITGHLDGVGVTKLMRSEATTDAGFERESPELRSTPPARPN